MVQIIMNNNLIINKYYRASNLEGNTILLTTNLPFISDSNIPYCIEALDLQISLADKIVLDISKTDHVDSTSLILLIKKITQITSLGISIKVIISKDKPRISYSLGDQVVELNKYVFQDTDIIDSVN
jgi:ABC-type transporter Mla MlaB component